MSASTRIPVILSTLSLAISTLAISTSSTLRSRLSSILPSSISTFFSTTATSYAKYTLLTLFLFLNLKSLPFVWHWRVLRGILYQIRFNPHPITASDLFRPIITESHNSLSECDYNLHKSNSTYFADLDVSRAHFVGALIRTGLTRLNKGDFDGLSPPGLSDGQKAQFAKGKKGTSGGGFDQQGYIIALGGVACVFRKEIKPLEQFEVWTRLLAWDRKWIYIVSHIVRKGAVKPEEWTMQPWKTERERRKRSRTVKGRDEGKILEEREDFTKAVFASSIAKYVCKKGRLTIAPEIVLGRSDLLPTRPENTPVPTETEDFERSGILVNGASDSSTPSGEELSSPENVGVNAAEAVTASLNGVAADGDEKETQGQQGMTWEQVEAERLRGLKIAEGFEGLTALHAEFGRDPYEHIDETDELGAERTGRRGPKVLGHYMDFFW